MPRKPPVRMGRPLRSAKPAEHRVTLRLTEAEFNKLVGVLRVDDGEKLSDILRDAGLREADRRLRR